MCVRTLIDVCVCVMHWCVCVSQKSNGNENNEARFCAHISKARQKERKKTKKITQGDKKIEWGAKKMGDVQKKYPAKLCVVSS